jgi:hypothetical protein
MNQQNPRLDSSNSSTQVASEESFYAVDLERKLRQDSTGAFKDSMLTQLGEHRSRLKSVISSGLNPAAMRPMQALEHAVNQAEVVIQSYWMATHPRN